MWDQEWVIIDTETTGLVAPVFVVDLAAQRMCGWQAVGPAFRRLLNHGMDIPPEASRVHGYTREILERDGDPPREVYRAFADYVGERTVASYNLRYDWDEVLLPEWERLALPSIGSRGLCLLRLAQRLLDPVPAGNCKLQSLRQFYNLPARGAHTAVGDVETVVDLLRRVLVPLIEARGLSTGADLARFVDATWFPARIPFGKYKGRNFREARRDASMRHWLQWLADSPNPRSSEMGRWYLEQLEAPPTTGSWSAAAVGAAGDALVIFRDPDVDRLEVLIAALRARLAELQAHYTELHSEIAANQARLFEHLRTLYQRRDLLQLRVDFRRKYLDALLSAGEEEAETVEQDYQQAREQTDRAYDEAARVTGQQRELSDEEKSELKALWRKLTRLFHPDRYHDDPARQESYTRLMAAINSARDEGNIERLREIAEDPEGFLKRHGLHHLDWRELQEIEALHALHDALQGQILEVLESLANLESSPENELYQWVRERTARFEEVVAEHQRKTQDQIEALETELAKIEQEVASLSTMPTPWTSGKG